MKDPLPYDVLPRAGWAPWAPTQCPRLGSEDPGRWKIIRNHPLDLEKTEKYDPLGKRETENLPFFD